MRAITAFIISVAVVANLSCAGRKYTPVPVTADDFDVSALVGKWAGEYHSDETGRSGNITFTLQSGEASAYGDVMMIPKAPTRSTAQVQHGIVGTQALGSVRELLTIHFVRKEGNTVVGMLDPYQDPECFCRVVTTFSGVFTDGGTIESTFRTKGTDQVSMRAQGNWKVARVKTL